MYSFLLRPKWIVFHLLVAAAIVGMLSASRWQWDRYNARNDFVERVEERNDIRRTEPVELVTLLDRSLDDIEYRVVTARGSYLPAGQLVQILRTQNGVNGVNVLTPFQIAGGPIVLVNRGFVPDGEAVPPPTTDEIVIGGTVRATQQRRTGELTDNAAGAVMEVRRVDLPAIEERIGLDLAPVYVDFIDSQPPSPEPPIPVPRPDVSGGPPHLSYTIQWLVFAVAVAVGWVLAVRRSVRSNRRRRTEVAEPDASTESVSAGAGPPAQPSA